MTIAGAEVAKAEWQIGSIEIGKWADLAVLSSDPIHCNIEDVPAIRSELTVTAGVVRYRHAEFQLT